MRWLLAALLAIGCTPDPPTEVMVVVSSDFPPDQLLGMRINVTRAADHSPLFSSCSCIGSGPKCAQLPAKLGLVSAGSLEHAFTVEAAGYSDAACGNFLVGQTATLQFFEHHTLELDLAVLQICKDKVCDPGSTCYDDGLCHDNTQSGLPEYNPNGRPDGGGSGPSPRLGAAMAYDPIRKRTVLVGGISDYFATQLLDDVWEWDGTRWSEVRSGSAPDARFSAGMIFEPTKKKLLLYGGLYRTDTFLYDGAWTNITASVGTGPEPEHPRLVYDLRRSQAFLTGEDQENWILSGGRWTKLTPAHMPSPRIKAAMAYFDPIGQTVLFGGTTTQNTSAVDETWLWDGVDWTQATGAGPPAQEGVGFVADASLGSLLMYGNGETWEWNGSWKKDSIAPPRAFSYPQLAYDSDRQVVVLFGGWDGNAVLGETWELGSDRVWRKR